MKRSIMTKAGIWAIAMAFLTGYTPVHGTMGSGEGLSEGPPPRKHALIVAVGSYSMSRTGWQRLNTAKDTLLVREALIRQGFAPGDIHVVYDGTKERIMGAIDSLLVNNKDVRRGDVVFFHFSGHGQQIQDQDGDEEDGYDEAIVPIDAPARADNREWRNYDGSRHIRDDELNERFLKVRRNLGPQGSMLMLIDACQSGTMSRGAGGGTEGTARGTPERWDFGRATPSPGKAGGERGNFGFDTGEGGAAPLFSFFGSSQFELNYEYTADTCGSASYAFSKAFANAAPGTSYRMLFEDMKWEMAHTCKVPNKPQFEGDPDRVLLSNTILGTPVRFTVREVVENDRLVLGAGHFHMVEEGARMKFYPPDTRDTSDIVPLAEGTVIKANLSSSLVRLSGPARAGLSKAWAYPVAPLVSPRIAKVRYEGRYNTLFELRSKYHGSRHVRFVDEQDAPNVLVRERYMRHGRDSALVYLVGPVPEGRLDTCKSEKDLCIRLEKMGRGIFLNSLAREWQASNDQPTLDLWLYTVTPRKEAGRWTYPVGGRLAAGHSHRDGVVRLTAQDTIDLELRDVRNGAKTSLYFTLFEVAPMHGFRTIKPRYDKATRRYDWPECQLGMGARTARGFAPTRMSPPFGEYAVLLFASSQSFDQSYFENYLTEEGIDRYVDRLFATSRGSGMEPSADEVVLPEDMRVIELRYEYVK